MNKTFMLWVLALFLVIPLAFGTTYFITDCAGLQNIQNDVTGDYVLSNNIDCSDSINWNNGEGFVPIANFTGQLNGDGYIVDKLFINRPLELHIGLFGFDFGSPNPNVIIKNLGMTNINYTCDQYCGAIAGWNPGLLNASFATGAIIGQFTAYVGGLVGVNQGNVINSWADVSICGFQNKAGIIAANAGSIENTYAIGSFDALGNCDNGNTRYGICGLNYAGTSSGKSYFNQEIMQISQFLKSDCMGGGLGSTEIPKNTSEMQNKNTYIGWDFINIWQICNRDSPPVYPSLQVFGLCCVGSWECSKYSACGNNKQECLKAKDINCGYTYNVSLDIPLSQLDKNCSINAQSPDISITNFDLRYSSNVLLLGLILALWIALFVLYFAFGNYAFAGANILLGVFLFILLFQQIFWVFALLFPICSIMAIIFLNKGD